MSASHSAARFACSLAVVLAALLALQPLHAAAADAPGAVELEFWRSSDRLGTASAYQAYLDAYPRGTFAPLARAGIEKAGASTTRPAVAAAGSERADAGTTLKPFSEEAPSTSAIPFLLGNRFVGPGAITVGWSGAKKQILLPPGTWVALAGLDYKSDQAPQYVSAAVPVRVSMTSVVFGRFAGNRPVTLLRYTFNSQRTIVTAWSDLDRCDEGSGTTQLSRTRTQTKFGETCASIRASDNWVALLGVNADETKRNLARLGASMPSGAAVVSVTSIGETRNGYLGATRIGFPGSGSAADWSPAAIAQNPARATWVRQLADWQKRYQAAANEGLTRNIDIAELTAGDAAAAASTTTVVDDFDVTTTPR